MSIRYDYALTGAERRALVQAITSILGMPATYRGAPTFAYAIGPYDLDRHGVLYCPETTKPSETSCLIRRLEEQGFKATLLENNGAGTLAPLPENPQYPMGFTIEIPRTGFPEAAYGNLMKIIASKATLLKKALGTDDLTVTTNAETLCFPWFTLKGEDGETEAYSQFVAALCKMARERKRVTAKESDDGNDKFHMRLFLVQLGLNGPEYKTARKILLKNLTGNSSWKSGHAPERTAPDTKI